MTDNRKSRSLDWTSRTAKFELEAANLVYEGLNTPISLSCHILLKHNCYDELVSKTIDPASYADVDSFKADYQAVSLLSKSLLLETSFNKEENAREKYFESEGLCLESNNFISLFERDLVSPIDKRLLTIIPMIRSRVSRVLGRVTKRTLKDIEHTMAFGPGATVGVKRVVTSGRKFDLPIIDTTPELLHFGLFCLPQMWRQTVIGFKPVAESELVFVPKNAKTHRAIEIQPTLNIFVQKGIGAQLRDRLLRSGLDLSSQKKNQDLAHRGSATGELVTLDLSSASDTIAFSVVRHLFSESPDWFELLNWARVQKVKDKGGVGIHPLEKFSAMGNGYTFELETLIFDSVVKSCLDFLGLDTDSSTYGDDMVFDVQAMHLVVETLKFLGFRVNTGKTFGSTYFRESCGADFFNGFNVRPFFFRKDGETYDEFRRVCYHYGNSILHASTHFYNGYGRDSRFRSAWLHCFTSVHSRDRFRVSPEYHSGGFLGSFDECAPSLVKAKHGWQGYFFKYLHQPIATTRSYQRGALLASLSGRMSSFTYGEESIRGRFLPATTKTGYSLDWPDFGPWKRG